MYTDDRQSMLTKRQTQIMLAIAERPGLSKAELAANFDITEGALRNHLTDINKRLGASNLLECFVECLKQSIIILSD